MRRTSIETWGNTLAAMLGLTLGACGGQTSGSGPGGSGPTVTRYPCESPTPVLGPDGSPTGIETCADGSSHRVEPVTCGSTLPRTDVECSSGIGGSSGTLDACTTDADCVEQDHGMCRQGFDATCSCTYGCTTDADCGDGYLCHCAEPVGRCVQATCRTDADCPGALECRSYAIPNGLCGETRFECQTAGDTCSYETCGDGCVLGDDGTHSCQNIGCAVPGRPFLIEGRPVMAPLQTRDDWGARALGETGSVVSVRVAEHFARAAAMEHASVAAFSRFVLELLALGAPADLVRDATLAAQDELRHAELCYGLASRFSRAPVGPGPLPLEGALGDVTLAGVVESVVREGCVGETVAALGAEEARARATDAEVRQALTEIARDETRHAALAWRFVRWAIEQDGAMAALVERVLDEEAARARIGVADESPSHGDDAAYGVLPVGVERSLRRDALERVVSPLFASMRREVIGPSRNCSTTARIV